MRIANPRRVSLEASTFCQLNCPQCPNANDSINKTIGKGFLRFEDFRRIVDKNPTIRQIELSNWGEIFLNEELVKIIRYAYVKGITLSGFNGVNLNTVPDSFIEALVRYKFFYLSCSIDGATPETYRKYRVGGNLTRVLKNIEMINKYKKEFNSPYPILRWQFVVFGHNEHEIEKARKLALEHNMIFTTKINWEANYSPIVHRKNTEKFTGVASNEEFLNKFQKPYLRRSCYQLWNHPQINWDGRVLGCCENSMFDFGSNAFSEGLCKSVNNKKIIYARQMLMGNLPPKEDIPCFHCSKYHEMKKSNSYINRLEIQLDNLKDLPPINYLFLKPKFHKGIALMKNYGQPILRRMVKYADILN